ncbi:MAG: hypothetical protein ACOCQ2_00775 [Halanaerobiales bacterium]
MNALNFDSREWHMLTIIFKQFNYDLNRFKKENSLDGHLWQIIIDIKEKWLEDIEQAIRYSTRLCYELEKDTKIKNINKSLYKFHNLFDRSFYRKNNDPHPGLEKFLKLVNVIFTDLKEFKKELRISKKMINFIKKRKDQQLINNFNYLKNISLPLNGYDNLRIALLTILKKLDHLKTLITIPAAYAEFIKEIKHFKKKYIATYLNKHQKFQQKLNYFKKRLNNLPEYRTLELLSKIDILEVTYNLKPVKNYLDNFFPKKCNLTKAEVAKELKYRPGCTCGFNFNESIIIPSLNKITPILKRGIIEHINQLINKEHFKEKLTYYVQKNPDSKIKDLLKINKDNLKTIINLVDNNLILDINKALNDTYNIKISLDKVMDNLQGSYSYSEIEKCGEILINSIKEELSQSKNKIGKIESKQIIINLI